MLSSEAKIRIRGGGHCTLSLPTPNEIRVAHEAFWNWIFSVNDGPNHPLNISGGRQAQEQLDNILIVAGSLPDNVGKNRSLRIPAGIDYIFVPADNCVDSLADGGGPTELDLMNSINNDINGAAGIAGVSLNGNNSKTVNLLTPHLFSLNIQKAIKDTGRNKKGEGTSKGRRTPISTMAAGACYYDMIPANNLRTGDTIEITGRKIKVTYTVS